MKELILRTLAMLVWASTEELAAQVERHRTTVLRHLGELSREGLVAFRMVGRQPTALQRWLLSADGVYQVYPQRHRHPGPRDGHLHDPRAGFIEPHSHPSHWNSEAGAAQLYGDRLQLIQFIYPLAINLFKGECARLHPDGVEARLLSFRWLEHGQLVAAVGEYPGNVTVFFGWVAQEYTDATLMRRWRLRFDGLLSASEAAEEPYDWDLPPDLGRDDSPRPSLWVLVAEDPGAFEISRRVLYDGIRWGARAWPLLRVCLSNPHMRHLEGRIFRTTDNIWDPPLDVIIGEPGRFGQLKLEDEENCDVDDA